MKIDNNMSEIFNLPDEPKKEALPTEIISSRNEVIPTSEKIVDSDFDKTRSNLHTLLQNGQEALYHALEIARTSEHPRAFEVVGNLMKQLADINQQLLDLHKQKRELTKDDEKELPKNVTQNAIFVGTNAELNQMIKKMIGDK
jgi:hypothetical protein